MIAPDETTFEYLKGRPHAPEGELWDQAVAYWKTLKTDDDAVFDTRSWTSRPTELEPLRDVGHQPRPGPADHRDRAGARQDFADATERAAAERALDIHGPQARHADQGHRRGHRVHRLAAPTAASTTCAQAAAIMKGHHKAENIHRVLVVPGVLPRAPAGGEGRPRQGVQGLRRRMAQRRLLDVPGHEPGQAGAGRALHLHIEPQLRRPPGQGLAARIWRRPPSPPPPPFAARSRRPADLCKPSPPASRQPKTDWATSPEEKTVTWKNSPH